MEITCWGSRGSISVSGSQTLKYGGDTTCIEITAKSGETVIVDAGTGIRRLGESLLRRDITQCHLLFTHAHWDHVLGFAFFRPLQFSRIKVVVQERDFSGLSTRQMLDRVMQAPFFPVGLADLAADITWDPGLTQGFSIGSLLVETIPTSHSGGGLGYKFTEGDRSFVFLTDNELGYDHPGGAGFDAYLDFCRDADILFHDGEYTADEYSGRVTWGHSSVPQLLDLALRAGVKKLGLFHINQERTDDQMDQIVAQCRADLKKTGSAMDCFAVACDLHLSL